jgi:hypothetical protein
MPGSCRPGVACVLHALSCGSSGAPGPRRPAGTASGCCEGSVERRCSGRRRRSTRRCARWRSPLSGSGARAGEAPSAPSCSRQGRWRAAVAPPGAGTRRSSRGAHVERDVAGARATCQLVVARRLLGRGVATREDGQPQSRADGDPERQHQEPPPAGRRRFDHDGGLHRHIAWLLLPLAIAQHCSAQVTKGTRPAAAAAVRSHRGGEIQSAPWQLVAGND